MGEDPLFDVPEPESRYSWNPPWGLIFAIALVPIALILLLLAVF
jgi:hypothetical protein